MKRFLLLCTVGLGAALPACGSLESNPNAAPTLATLQGSLANPNGVEVASTTDVRVAVVWRVNGPNQPFHVSQDLPVQAMFPSSFSIALRVPPPVDAMNVLLPRLPVIYCVPDSGIPESPECAHVAAADEAGPPGADEQTGAAPGEDAAPPAPTSEPPPATPPRTKPSPSAQYAVGTLVAYVDQNHNGKLDLVADDATSYVDQILATNAKISVVYVQGPVIDGFPFARVPDAAGHRPVDGYNLLSIPPCNDQPQPYGFVCANAPDPGPCAPAAWLPIDSLYPLTVASGPEVSRLMCADVPLGVDEASGTSGPFDPAIQPAQYPAATDPSVCCSADGLDYLYFTCTSVPNGLCKGVVEGCVSTGYERPTPAPAGWPCTE